MGNERLRERDLAMKVIEKEKGFWAMKVKKKKKNRIQVCYRPALTP